MFSGHHSQLSGKTLIPDELKSFVQGGYQYVLAPPGRKHADGKVENGATYPLVVSLHGASLRGNKTSMLSKYGTIAALQSGLELPAYVVAPQCPSHQRWDPKRIWRVIESVASRYPIDTTRIYVIGMSMGGYGTFDFVGTYPDKVAAAIAMCGGGQSSMASNLSTVPLWVIHGRMDRDVPPSQSRRIVSAICNIDSSRCYYTELDKLGHSALAESYNHVKLYEWLFKHSNDGESARMAVAPPGYSAADFSWTRSSGKKKMAKRRRAHRHRGKRR